MTITYFFWFTYTNDNGLQIFYMKIDTVEHSR